MYCTKHIVNKYSPKMGLNTTYFVILEVAPGGNVGPSSVRHLAADEFIIAQRLPGILPFYRLSPAQTLRSPAKEIR